MNEFFLKIVNMSISASWLVLAVLILRLVLKKVPKWVNVLLWGIVAVRLICPFSIESALSLIPSAEVISPTVLIETPEINTGIPIINNTINPIIQESVVTISPEKSISTMKLAIQIFSRVWIAGVILLLAYTVISYRRLNREIKTAVLYRDNIFLSENVSSPFVLGIIKPRIYLPFKMDAGDLEHVVAHEKAHIRRKDHWWKPLGFLLLTIHWFNPLVLVAYILLCRDIELACDEKVIKELGNEQRADYTQALVACSVNRRMIAACPLAFGEVGVKERVKSIMNYRKPTFWIIVIAVVVCTVVAVCFLTNPTAPREFSMTGNNLSDLDVDTILEHIQKIEGQDDGTIYMNSDNFSLSVNSEFDWVYSQTVRYFFYENQEIHSAQLRIFPDEDKFYITESSQWVEQDRIFLLRHYLEALKYLPQEEIRQLAPADQYIIQHVDGGRPSDYDRVITYSSEGAGQTDGWFIHLMVQPLYEADGGSYQGRGDEIIDLFYGDSAENTVMVPTSSNMSGLFDSYLYLTIDGATYRYERQTTDTQSVEVGDYIDTLCENTNSYTIYSVKGCDDLSMVLAVNPQYGGGVYCYSPSKRCDDSALQEAKNAGYVVMEDGYATSGQEAWLDFYEATQRGKAASITVAHYYTLDPQRCSSTYYEVYKEDYPQIFIQELTFDGQVYTLTWDEYGTVYTRTYEYLMRYVTNNYSVVSSTLPENSVSYILTHDDTVTLEELFHGLVSSQAGAYIDHYSIYTEKEK